MNITIKKTEQYEKATNVAEACRDFFETGMEQLTKDIRSHFLYGAFIEEELAGFITYKESNEDVIEITWLAVLPKYRNMGIGTKLVKQTLEDLKRKYKVCEVKTLAETHPDPGYVKTRSFYKKLGFVSLEIITPYPGWSDDNPCQIFIRFLQ
jgi:ribosomal protein S18 acetylase RimI-like enzyme